MSEFLLLILILAANILVYIFSEVSLYRRGGDVYDYTVKLDKLLRKIGL